MKKATAGQRILAYIIDLIIVGVIAYLINYLLGLVLGFPAVPAGYYEVIMSGDSQALVEFTESAEFLAYQASNAIANIISVIEGIVLFSLYFIVIPNFTKKTVGRAIMKIKVVSDDKEEATVGKLILREFVGVLIIGCIGCICCGATLIANLVMLIGKGTTIHDNLAGTTMVSTVLMDDEEVIDAE